jgi:hypothetical protein
MMSELREICAHMISPGETSPPCRQKNECPHSMMARLLCVFDVRHRFQLADDATTLVGASQSGYNARRKFDVERRLHRLNPQPTTAKRRNAQSPTPTAIPPL